MDSTKDGKVGQDNSNSVEHGPFFRLKTSRDLPCGQALFLNFVLGSFKVILTKNKNVSPCILHKDLDVGIIRRRKVCKVKESKA